MRLESSFPTPDTRVDRHRWLSGESNSHTTVYGTPLGWNPRVPGGLRSSFLR